MSFKNTVLLFSGLWLFGCQSDLSHKLPGHISADAPFLVYYFTPNDCSGCIPMYGYEISEMVTAHQISPDQVCVLFDPDLRKVEQAAYQQEIFTEVQLQQQAHYFSDAELLQQLKTEHALHNGCFYWLHVPGQQDQIKNFKHIGN